jgi:hypothetical protein
MRASMSSAECALRHHTGFMSRGSIGFLRRIAAPLQLEPVRLRVSACSLANSRIASSQVTGEAGT